MLEAGNHTEALVAAGEALEADFDDGRALYVAGIALYRAQRFGLAYNLFKRCAQLAPERSEAWNMQGVCAEQLWKLDLAERCFKEAIKRDPGSHAALENMALLEVNRCNPEEALKWCDRVAKLGVETSESLENRAMALLMKRDWSGWVPYRKTSGLTKPRAMRAYNDPEEPMWNGEPGNVVVYTNQGIGDETAFASCLPDAMQKANIILDCDERMVGLFKRSFPDARVYGTRFLDTRDWDHPVDYSIPIDCLPGLFRKKDSDFPGTPYLKADPERRLQWRALFDTYKKPVIGVAWSGGSRHTGTFKRSLTLEAMKPIFQAVDATWVSLEYRDRRQQIEDFEMETGVEIKDFPRVVHAVDYDETAAMVAELDLVITVTTAVVHLCGALGKEAWCLAPNRPRWWYGLEGDLPWYKSVRMFRQSRDGRWPIQEVADCLKRRGSS